MNKPNYRIYDHTGSGVTEDIYAETLEDAIEAGRDWIEAGDWEQGECDETLDCEVGEIVYRAPRPELDGTESSRVDDLLDLDCAPDSIRGECYEDMSREQLAALADYLDAADPSVSDEDQELDSSIAEQIRSALDGEDEIDEDATWEAERYDCSGTLPAKDASKCIDDETEHDWQSPYSVVGGLKENPGVRGSGHGQICTKEVCACCGLYKTTDNWSANCASRTSSSRTNNN